LTGCRPIQIAEEEGEGNEEGEADDVLNPFDMGVEVDEGMKLLRDANGNQVLSKQFAELPVHLRQTTDYGGNGIQKYKSTAYNRYLE